MLNSRERRESNGRYKIQQRCDCCSLPIHGQHGTDDEVCAGSDDPGFFLCSRVKCGAKYDDKAVEERRAIFTAGRAKAYALTHKGT